MGQVVGQVGSIYVEVRGDISQLDTDLRAARGMVREAANDISDSMANALKPNQITSGISSMVGRFSELSNYAKTAGKSFDGLGVNLGELQKLTGMASDQFGKLQARFLEVQAVKTAENALKDMGNRLQLTSSEVQKMGEQFNLSSNSIKKVQDALTGATNAGKGFGSIIENTFLYGSAYRLLGAIQELPGAILEASAKMEALRRSFDGIFGNEEGPKQFAYAGEMARKYGKDIEGLAEGYRKFSAAAEFMGVSVDTTKRVFEAVTEAITKTGGTSEDVSTSLGALEHMMSKGTVTAEVFRRQFASHIPGAMKIGAEAMGVTTAEFNRMMKAGEIASMDLIPKLVAPLERMAEGWEKSADTVLANTNRLKNDMKSLADSDAIQTWANTTVKFMDKVIKKAQEVADSLEKNRKFASRDSWGVMPEGGTDDEKLAALKTVANMPDLDKMKFYNSQLEDLGKKREAIISAYYAQGGGLNSSIGAAMPIDSQMNNLERMKKELTWVMQLKEALADTENLASKGIEVKTNTEKAEWLAKMLSDLTGTLYTVHISTEVNTDPLIKAINLIDRLYAKSAESKLGMATASMGVLTPETRQELQGRIDASQRELRGATGDRAVDLASGRLDSAKAALDHFDISLGEAKKEAADAQKAVSAQTQSRVDPYYGTSPGEFLGLGDKANARTSKYWSDFNKSGISAKMLDPDPGIAQVARAKWAAISQELADGIQKDKDAAAKKAMGAARHDLQVEKLGDTVDNYINKSLSGANSDPLQAKFDDIHQKVQGLLSRAKELSLQGGVSVQEFTDKLKPAEEAARQLAAQNQIETLFPYLKKDAALQGFWNDIYFHYDYMDAAAKKLGTTVKEMWDKMSGVGVYKVDLSNLKSAMAYAGNFGDYSKAYKAVSAKEYQDNGEQEQKVWLDLANTYDTLSSKMLETRSAMYDRVVAKAKAAGYDEATATKYAQLAQEKDAQANLAKSLNYAGSFGEYAGGRALQDTGVGTKLSKSLDDWEKYYKDLKSMAETWENDARSSVAGFLDAAISGNTKKAEESWKDMLAKMRKDLLDALVTMTMDVAKHNIFQPLAAGVLGAAVPGASDKASAANGLAGTQSTLSAMLPATRQYGLTGLIGGTAGAPSLISALTSNSGSSGSSNASSSFLTGGGGGSDASSYSSGLSMVVSAGGMTSDQQAQAATLVSQYGISPDVATQIAMSSGSPFGASTGADKSTSSSSSGSDLLSDLGYAKSLYSLATSGSSAATSLGSWTPAAGADYSTWTAGSGGATGTATGSTLMGVAGSALAAGGIGYLAGGYMEPQGSGASIAGGLTGAAVGGTLALTGLETGLAATGYGAIAALAIAAITALASPSTESTNPNGSNGNTISIPAGTALQGYSPLWGYEGFTQTTTGSFGSGGTKHFTEPTTADPALTKQWNQAMNTQTAGLTGGLNALGVGTSALDNYSFPVDFDINSSNLQQAAVNISTDMAKTAIQASALSQSFQNALEPGEDYIDEITRISAAYATTNVAAQQAGTSLAALSGSSDSVGQGDWASQVGALMGGNSNVSTAFQNIANAQSKPALAASNLSAYGSQADTAISLIGNPDLNKSNFWGSYGQAMQSPMDPATFQAWANAAAWMGQFNAAEQQAGATIQQVNNLQIQGLQAQLQAVQSVKVMVDGLDQSVQSAYSSVNALSNTLTSTLQGLQWSSSLSPNTPMQTYSQQSAYYQQLKGNVAGEDPSSITYSQDIQKLTSFAQTFLTTSKSVNGMSQAYYNDYNDVTQTLQNLQTPIDAQLAALKSQLQDQDALVNSANEQITQLQLANTSISLTNTAITVLGQDTVTGFNNLSSAMAQIAGVVTTLQAQYSLTTILGQTLGLPGFAAGGYHTGGWRIVGENGPELEATGAATIFNAQTTKAIFSGGQPAASKSSSGPDLSHAALIQSNKIAAQGHKAVAGGIAESNRHLAGLHNHAKLAAARPARAR